MDAATLARCTGAQMGKALIYAPFFTAAMQEFEIDTPVRQAPFLAQCGHESEGLLFMEEIWGPTPAQVRYEPPCSKSFDLGNTHKGDGKRFKGRGPIQITGRKNYRLCGAAFGVDLEQFPELLSEPAMGCRGSAWFWASNGLNALADAGQFIAITRRINGGTTALDKREALWAQAKEALGIA